MIKDKRGQEQSTTVTWVIVLIIMVLAVISIWWAYDTFQKGTFPWQKSTISIVAQACSTACTGNDQFAYCTVAQACSTACTGNDQFAYCTEEKTIKITKNDYESLGIEAKKAQLEDAKLSIDSTQRSVKGTCEELAGSRNVINWFVSNCDTIDCSAA